MKVLKFLSVFVLLISCKSYMEYTAGIKEIDYSFDNLTVRRFHDLDVALSYPEKVIFLDISFSSAKDPQLVFSRLNSNIEKFTHLKKLTLEGNDVYPVPENIFRMHSLEFLTLSSFKDSSAMARLNELQNLRFLGLDFCGLNSVPPSVLQLNKLQGLDLTGNEISYLPEGIADLSELVTIDLTNNLFTEIPSVLTRSPKLKYLDLNNAEGTDREKLRSYHVGVNKINYVRDLKEFRSLKELYVTDAYNGMDSLNKQYAHVKVR